MMKSSDPIFKGAKNEKACIAVMSKLRFKGECLDALHEQVNKSLEALEALIVAEPDNKALKTLLLQTMEIHKRHKTVASYKTPTDQKTKDGKTVYETNQYAKYIKNDAEWTVSVTKSGGVRIHLTEAIRKEVLEYIKTLPNSSDHRAY